MSKKQYWYLIGYKDGEKQNSLPIGLDHPVRPSDFEEDARFMECLRTVRNVGPDTVILTCCPAGTQESEE